MSEQLGTGAEAQVVTLSSKPTIATVPSTFTVTTTDALVIAAAVNSVLDALSDLGLITKS